ncbi:hypothetical protein ACQKJC_24460 [Priestia koreensis]|uniref:hypothetical protein n=1 Tax=Priestia koreensis TaxID=284581 RepID=UPI003D02B8BF
MKENIVYDFTSINGILESLSKYLKIEQKSIINYISNLRIGFDLIQFLEDHRIEDEQLLECDLSLVSLHVTTNNDECASIKKYGLINLQKAISLETPVSNFLRSQGISINIEQQQIHYNGKIYSISEDSMNEDIKLIYYKLYNDYQVNSFLSYSNVLEYGVESVPEFIENLADLLESNDICDNWIKFNNQCYVIKFVAPLSNYADHNFYEQGCNRLSKEDFQFLSEELELLKRIWILNQSFNIIINYYTWNQIKDLFGILKFDVEVPNTDIKKIYTPDEYLNEYQID